LSSEEKLDSFLKTGADWSKLKTSVPGIFVIKMPVYKNSPARLAVELNPVDGSGTPTKKRGLMIRTKDELEEFRQLFVSDKLGQLLEGVQRVNPPVAKSQGSRSSNDVLEI
jgi:hypothetical protein